MYLPCFSGAMKFPAMKSAEIELVEVSVSPRGWPQMLLSIRKHSQSQQPLNITTTVQTQNPTERALSIDHFRTRPVLTLAMTAPLSATTATKQQFITLLGELATVKNISGKALIAILKIKMRRPPMKPGSSWLNRGILKQTFATLASWCQTTRT